MATPSKFIDLTQGRFGLRRRATGDVFSFAGPAESCFGKVDAFGWYVGEGYALGGLLVSHSVCVAFSRWLTAPKRRSSGRVHIFALGGKLKKGQYSIRLAEQIGLR
jgi:hypothetical protein